MNSVEPTQSVPVAIIGMGCLFPKADDLERYWSNIRAGVDAITEVPETHWRPADYFDPDPKAPDRTYAHRGGFLTPVDFPALDFGIAPNNIEATDTSQLLGLMVARQALEDAGYGADREFDHDRVSVILGVTGTLELVIPLGARLGHPIWRRALKAAGVPEATAEDVVKRISDSYVGWQENSFPGLLGNVAAGRIANRLDLGGTNCVIDAACASSLGAVHLALLELATGRSDMVLSGGLDTFNDIFMYMCFSKTPALSPTGDARPFDASCDGTILGEGLGMVVLKRLDDARRDGDRIYAVIRGIGTSSDGKGGAVYAPKAAGQMSAIRAAYAMAGVTPETIELVEAHGTGTKVGDATEVEALTEVYRASSGVGTWCALGSVKSQIGHTKAAAGAAGLIKAALALHHKVLPPTAKVTRPIEPIASGGSPFYLNNEPRPWMPRSEHPRRAAVSAFGFGGSNFHCVLEEADGEKSAIEWDGDVQIVALSAPDRERLSAMLEAWPTDLAWDALRVEAGRSRERFSHDEPCRLLIVLDRRSDDWAKPLRSARTLLAGAKGKNFAASADGVYLGFGPVPGRLAMLFPGQGSQYVGMLRDLACGFPAMHDALADADALPLDAGRRLSDLIYPHPAFADDTRAARETALRATEVAQPAIGAVSLGVLAILDQFGVRPDAVAGHSFGELTALGAAGRIDVRAMAMLARRRGQLMAGQAQAGDQGSMLAVLGPLEHVESILTEARLDVVVANKNAPKQAVLSGPSGEIERAERVFQERRVSCRPLAVSAAFHSRLVAEAEGPFLDALRSVAFTTTTIPVFSNTTARPYPDDHDEARALMAGQLAQPVEFVEQVRAMSRWGVRTFLEVGPDNKLTGLVNAILEGTDHVALAVDASRGQRGNAVDLARALAQLAALGHPVRLPLWDEGAAARASTRRNQHGLTVKVCGAHPTPKPQPSTAPIPTPEPKPLMKTPTPRAETNGDAKVHHQGRNGTAPEPLKSSTNGTPAPSKPLASPALPDLRSGDPGLLAQALRDTRESLVSLQKLGEQTAQLHRQFLDGQEKSHRSFQSLLDQQQRLVLASLGLEVPAMPTSPAEIIPPRALRSEPARWQGSVSDPGVVARGPGSGVALVACPPVRLGASDAEDTGGQATSATPDPGHPTGTSTLTSEHIQGILLAVVSDKTGYPVEMLDPDMQLDADLGIDSIKRVEILSALQERLPEAPVVKPEHLGTLRTLRQIVEFLGQGSSEPVAPTLTPSASTLTSDRIQGILLAVVSEKTGYPVEMLDPDMQLDADLGIDSIKRVEILSALQERLPEAPVVKPEHLGTLRTLRQIVEFLGQGSPTAPVERPAASTTLSSDKVQTVLLAVVSDKTGYPVEMLDPDMQFDADLGIDSIKRVEILSALQERLPEAPVVKPEHLGTLRTLRQIVEFLGQGSPTVNETKRALVAPLKEVPLDVVNRLVVTSIPLGDRLGSDTIAVRAGGEIWIGDDGSDLPPALIRELAGRGYRGRLIRRDEIATLPAPARLDGLILLAAPDENGDAIKDAFRLLRTAGGGLRATGRDGVAVLATVSRLDGSFGLSGQAGLIEPTSGGLAGLAKTARHEWPEVHCKAIDVDPCDGDVDWSAASIVDEMLCRGPAEVGLSGERRTTPALSPVAFNGDGRESPLAPGDVVVMTGGARGITAEVAVALAEAFQPTVVVLGRSAEPGPEPAWLAAIDGEAEIKRALLAHSAERPTPQALGESYRRIEAGREIVRNLRRIEAAGGRAVYRSVDVRDQDAIAALLDSIRAEFGPIRGLIHGAGVLADRRIEDKNDEQFASVFDTKVAGLQGLLRALDDDDLKVLVLFSSSTARFGRLGQVAYAAANEVLNKVAQREALTRSSCRVVSVNWGPWNGGMVSASLKAIFASEGVALIEPGAGARYLVEEIQTVSDRPVEIVVLGGGSAASLWQSPAPVVPAPPATPLNTVFERVVDLATTPVLASHVIDGRPVLPMALILEWLAQGALQRNPGLAFCGVDDLRILKGVILRDGDASSVRIMAGKAVRKGALYHVPVELRGTLGDGKEVPHARGEVILSERLPQGRRSIEAQGLALRPYERDKADFYRDILFHGPALQGLERVEGLSAAGIAAHASAGPMPSAWLDRPLRREWLSDPLAIDGAFQMLILWCFERLGACSLPTRIGHYRQYRRAFPTNGVHLLARINQSSAHRALADIEFLDADGTLVARIEGYECVVDASLHQAFRRNSLAQVASR